MIQIEDISTAPNRFSRYPFDQLAVGQSFFVANLPSGRRAPVPFAAAKAAFAERKFNRVVTDAGVRYGRIG
jgi:hypothetical protein